MKKIKVEKVAYKTTDGKVFYSKIKARTWEITQFKESIFDEFKSKIIYGLGLSAKQIRTIQKESEDIDGFDDEVMHALMSKNKEFKPFCHECGIDEIEELVNLILDMVALNDGILVNIMNQIYKRQKEEIG